MIFGSLGDPDHIREHDLVRSCSIITFKYTMGEIVISQKPTFVSILNDVLTLLILILAFLSNQKLLPRRFYYVIALHQFSSSSLFLFHSEADVLFLPWVCRVLVGRVFGVWLLAALLFLCSVLVFLLLTDCEFLFKFN